nr:MFS transporter [Fluoribacter dumoffii]
MAWVVCLSAGLFFLYEFFQLNIFDVINQPLRDDFHIDATQLSWMSSAYLWADILFLLPAGIILDRFSTRTVILSAMFICVLGTVGFALTHSFILASFCHFLSGIGNAFCFLSCVVLVSHWFPPRRQALVIGSLVTMAFVGGMMAHTPFAYLYELFGWRKALLIDGAVGAVLLLWIYWVVRDKPEDSPAKMNTNQGQVISGFIKALSNSQNWLAGFYTSFLNLPIMVLCALWGASYLQVVHHLPEMAASNVVSLIFMGSVIGCPLAGWLSDSQGRRKPLMIAGAIATLVTVIPLFLDIALSQTTLSVIFFALGFFTSTQVITYPLVAESNSTDNTGAATGIASVIIMGGGGVGQVLFGWLITHHAGASVANYTVADFQYAMWMFPITTVAALLAVLITRETYCKR